MWLGNIVQIYSVGLFCVRCCDILNGNIEYFIKINKLIEDEATIKALYDYFMSVEVNAKFQEMITPVTE